MSIPDKRNRLLKRWAAFKHSLGRMGFTTVPNGQGPCEGCGRDRVGVHCTVITLHPPWVCSWQKDSHLAWCIRTQKGELVQGTGLPTLELATTVLFADLSVDLAYSMLDIGQNWSSVHPFSGSGVPAHVVGVPRPSASNRIVLP